MAAPVGVMSGCGLVSTYWEHIDHVDVVISLVSEIISMNDECKLLEHLKPSICHPIVCFLLMFAACVGFSFLSLLRKQENARIMDL